MKKNLISIIIPTFNRSHTIIDTLKSISKQTYTNWECIIVDDESTDESEYIINKFIKKDIRFIYYRRPTRLPKGACSCRNYGFTLAKGEFVKWFDSDDIMKPNFLEIQIRFLEKHKEQDFCACQWEYFWEDKSVKKNYVKLTTDKLPIYSFFLEGHIFATPAPLWRTSFLQGKDLFDEKLKRSQESDFHFRMLLHEPTYTILEDFLFLVRRGHDSIEKNSFSQEAQLSVHYFFKKSIQQLKSKKYRGLDAGKLEKYLVFRLLNQKYLLFSNSKDFQKRKELSRKIKLDFKYTQPFTIVERGKILLGYYLSLFVARGYSFLNLKKYDYRKH